MDSTITCSIEYDAAKNQFLVTVPPWLNAMARAIPNRRWNAKDRVWRAPAIRANARYLLGLLGTGAGHITADRETQVALTAALQPPKAIQETFPSWYKFKTEPRPYQSTALEFMWGRPQGGLFMDMGLGKSKVYIDYACAMRMANRINCVAVLCPVSIRDQWVEEIEKHAPIPISAYVLSGNGVEFDKWFRKKPYFPWLIVGIESMSVGKFAPQTLERYMLSDTRIGMIVDEASKIKSHDAIRSREIVRMGRMASTRHIATGTPISHGPMDLYMEFEFLDPQIIGVGDWYSFRSRYAIMGGFEGRQIVGYQNLEELTEIVSPFVYQVKKEEVAKDLPPKTYQVRKVQLKGNQRLLYDKVKREIEVEAAEGAITTENALVKLLRLNEITSGFATYTRENDNGEIETYRTGFDPDPKVEELLAIVRDTDESTIVWCAFRSQIHRVVTALAKEYGVGSIVQYHGDVNREGRAVAKRLFQDGTARFFVGNAATGGLGLNLQRGTVMVYMSNTFNSIDREQSEDRFHRIGQTRMTTVIDILAEKTHDHKIMENLKMKKDIATYVAESIRQRKLDLS